MQFAFFYEVREGEDILRRSAKTSALCLKEIMVTGSMFKDESSDYSISYKTTLIKDGSVDRLK